MKSNAQIKAGRSTNGKQLGFLRDEPAILPLVSACSSLTEMVLFSLTVVTFLWFVDISGAVRQN